MSLCYFRTTQIILTTIIIIMLFLIGGTFQVYMLKLLNYFSFTDAAGVMSSLSRTKSGMVSF